MKTEEPILTLRVPAEFNFEECLVVLERSPLENLYGIRNKHIRKLLVHEGEMIFIEIAHAECALRIEFLTGTPSSGGISAVQAFVEEWFDLQTDLLPFYEMAAQDPILHELVKKHYGLRLLCIPDLFEVLSWAVMGQQINLAFAYTMKKRFVENFGESFVVDGETHWAFPTCEKIAEIEVDELRQLQFTAKKAEYIIGIARAMANGDLSKQALMREKDEQKVEQALTAIRGIGPWTANYAMMRCLHVPSAFPLVDVGLHNALKKLLEREHKPALSEVEALSKKWNGWQAYAAFYLWRTLYE
ncbi:DNA-3-methyladenine glycosylase family protein [Planococcus sp. YIM B11945]|uniref:DNA-3-methyladenine glycosylase family protein n=1 Tax=Planococcus sp. YIM B11945 TaxID=3435410 RepID=UPI003D7F0531